MEKGKDRVLDITLRVSLIIVIILYFVVIFVKLKRKKLILKYSLLWLLTGIVLSILICFPGLLMKAANAVGIKEEMNGLFVFSIVFCIILLMSLTTIVTNLHQKVKVLTQELAIMERRIREMEKQ